MSQIRPSATDRLDTQSAPQNGPTLRMEAQSQATVSSAIADVIRSECNHCFGLIGNANSYFTSALTESGFGYTSVRHEAAAVAAADAFYRAGGGMAVATTTCGAGFTNTVTSLAEAKVARIPLIYVTGTHPATPRPFDIDQATLLDAMGILYITATPSSARADAQIAVELAQNLREPVVLLIPFDLQSAPLVDDGAVATNAHKPGSAIASSAQAQRPIHVDNSTDLDHSTTSVEEIATILSQAKRPLIISGRGVSLSGTAELVRTIGDQLDAVFMHSAMARGIIDSPWTAGTVGGFAHRNHVDLAQQADVVLVLGASWNAFQRRGGNMFAPDSKIVHIIDEPHAAQGPADYRLYSDLADVLPVLSSHLSSRREAQGRLDGRFSTSSVSTLVASPPSWREELGQLPLPEDPETQPELFAELGADGRLDPRASLRTLDAILPAQRAICTDGGHFLGWVPKYLTVSSPEQQVIVGTAIQTIGLGMGSLLGISAARTEDYCVLVTGDGGGLMGFADFHSAIQSMHRGAIVFMNDAAYGAELHQYAAKGLDTSSMVIDDIDFATMGTVCGARGFTISSMEDFDELREYFASLPEDDSKHVAVIDLKISRHVVADFVTEVLARSSKV